LHSFASTDPLQVQGLSTMCRVEQRKKK
jgi:hypothetical protein